MKQEGKVGLLRKMVYAFRTMLLDFPAVAFEKKNNPKEVGVGGGGWEKAQRAGVHV